MKKVLVWLGIAFLIFMIGFQPKNAAHIASGIGGTVVTMFKNTGTFVGNIHIPGL